MEGAGTTQGRGLANEHRPGGARSRLPGRSPGWACPPVTRGAARANGRGVAGWQAGLAAGGFRTPTGGLPDRLTFGCNAGGVRRGWRWRGPGSKCPGCTTSTCWSRRSTCWSPGSGLCSVSCLGRGRGARGGGLGSLGGILPGPGPGGRGAEGGGAGRREPRARTRLFAAGTRGGGLVAEGALPRLGRPSGGQDS